jgi:hypothetical protein
MLTVDLGKMKGTPVSGTFTVTRVRKGFRSSADDNSLIPKSPDERVKQLPSYFAQDNVIGLHVNGSLLIARAKVVVTSSLSQR